MNDRILSVALILLILFVACFVAGPVFSGEHPWDSDRGDDGEGDGDGDDDDFLCDTIVVIPDTVMILGSSGGTGNDDVSSVWFGIWSGIWTRIWSAMSAVF